MAEKFLENAVCQACGAAARRNSLFCYNCGTAVSPETMAKTGDYAGLTVGDALQQETLKADNSPGNNPKITNRLEEPIPKPSNLPIDTNPLDDVNKSKKSTEVKLKSAAELRQESKTALKKSVKISWEEPQNAPNLWFLITTFILTLFAVGILVAMLYIR